MAFYRSHCCDVTLARSGRIVEATDTVEVTLPTVVTGRPRPQKVRLDVSEQGKRDLEKAVKQAEEKARDAYSDIIKIVDKRESMNGRSKSAASSSSSTEQQPSPAQGDSPEPAGSAD